MTILYGILADFTAIILGGVIGNCIKSKFSKINISSLYIICGIIVMMTSAIGFFSNMITVKNNSLQSPYLMLIVTCVFIGTVIGEIAGLEEKIYANKKVTSYEEQSEKSRAIITGIIIFAVGGLQIIGPINSFVKNDNSSLILKAVIDFPFAISLGAALGSWVALSSFAVALVQISIGVVAVLFKSFFTNAVICQLCGIGYLILFFTGFNFIFEKLISIKTVNMLPSIVLLLCYNLIIIL